MVKKKKKKKVMKNNDINSKREWRKERGAG
jgi:hypothetical protein